MEGLSYMQVLAHSKKAAMRIDDLSLRLFLDLPALLVFGHEQHTHA